MKNKEGNESITERLIIQIIKTKQPKSTEELVNFVHNESDLSKKEILDFIVDLKHLGKINFVTSKKNTSESNYFFSSKSFWFWISIPLVILIGYSFFFYDETVFFVNLRYLTGLLLTFFLPGFCLSKALFPRNEISTLIRFILSVAITMSLVILVGLALNYTDEGIIASSSVSILLTLTMVFGAVGFIRGYFVQKVQ